MPPAELDAEKVQKMEPGRVADVGKVAKLEKDGTGTTGQAAKPSLDPSIKIHGGGTSVSAADIKAGTGRNRMALLGMVTGQAIVRW